MTISHWDRLPDNIKGLVYQFDSTAKLKFNEVLDELELKFNKAIIVQCKHIYRQSVDIDYKFIVSKIQMRRKSKISKYYVKRTHAMIISFCYLEPRDFNERAQMFKEKSMDVLNKWASLVRHYPCKVAYFALCLKKNWSLYKRILN